MSPVIHISNWSLVLALGFILMAQAGSAAFRLGLGRDLLVGTIRTFGQLFLMGWVLRYVFEVKLLWVTLLVFLVMITTAAHVIRGRVQEKSVGVALPAFVSMLLSYFVISWIVTGLIVDAEPWWTPQYFIPLAGMVVGNSMTALAISVDRLLSDLGARRDEVEMMLSLGADAREASRPMVRDAVRAGMIPAINSMMGVGLVFIPGMMTGQILAGADPVAAIRYQIVVMLMLVGSQALGSMIMVFWVKSRVFGRGQRLLLSHD